MPIATVNKWGNSVGVRLPSSALKAARLRLGDRVRIAVEGGAIVLVPESVPPQYRLEDLVGRITARNRQAAVSSGSRVGREEW